MKEMMKKEIQELENPNITGITDSADSKKADDKEDIVKNTSKTSPDARIATRLSERVIDGLFNSDRTTGISTGYRGIDKLVGGLRMGGLTVLVASTGMGKSILAMNILVNINRDMQKPVVYIDLENGILETTERLVKIWHGENLPEDFFTATKPEKQEQYKKDLVEMKKEFETFHYYSHSDFKSMDKRTILNVVKWWAKQGVKVFLIDPLECIPGEDVYDKQREEGVIVRELKNLAQDYKISIILCHHFRKTSSNGRDTFVGAIEDVDTPKIRIPTLDDMRGTSEIGDASTGVMALVRMNGADNNTGNDIALFRVLKNRFGNLGDMYLKFTPNPLGFSELSTEELIEFLEKKSIKSKKRVEKSKKDTDIEQNIEKDEGLLQISIDTELG